MHETAFDRARARLAAASGGQPDPADTTAALERARAGIEALAETTADLRAGLPERVGQAVREGVRAEASPVARQLAEVRGLAGQTIRRLEHLDGDLTAERHARVDDLALLVDLISSGWKAVDERLAHLEALFDAGEKAVVLRLEERR